MILVRMKSDYEKGQGTVMARYGSANEMHERILKSALEVFFSKGLFRGDDSGYQQSGRLQYGDCLSAF